MSTVIGERVVKDKDWQSAQSVFGSVFTNAVGLQDPVISWFINISFKEFNKTLLRARKLNPIDERTIPHPNQSGIPKTIQNI